MPPSRSHLRKWRRPNITTLTRWLARQRLRRGGLSLKEGPMGLIIPDGSAREDRLILVGMTGIMLAMSVLVYSPVEVPVVDDWTYAWSVENFLHTGELRMLEWSAHYPLGQSSGGPCSAGCSGSRSPPYASPPWCWRGQDCFAFYGTLREVGIRPPLAGLGTLLLWCNPVVFVLSHSFMTDVPFVSAMNTAILFYVRWVMRGRTGDLSLGSVAALLACLIRQPGAALALIPLAYLLLDRMAGGERRALPWSQGVWLLIPFLGVGLTFWWIHAVHGETRVAHEKAQMLRLIFAIDRWVWVYVRELLHAMMHLGLVLSPLVWMAFGQLSMHTLAGASVAVAVLSGLILWQEGALPNPLGVMLTWDELGHSRVLIAGEIAHRQLPRWGQAVILGVSLSGAVGLVAVLWDRLRQWPSKSREPDTVLLLNLCLQGLLFEALWLYYDRYYLPLLPGCMALLLMGLRPTKIAIMVGTAGVLLWGADAQAHGQPPCLRPCRPSTGSRRAEARSSASQPRSRAGRSRRSLRGTRNPDGGHRPPRGGRFRRRPLGPAGRPPPGPRWVARSYRCRDADRFA